MRAEKQTVYCWLLGSTIAALAMLGGVPNSRLGRASAEDLRPLSIGIGAPVVTSLPVYMAREAGLYEKYGLAAEIIDIDGGSRSLQVLLAGGIDVAHAGLSSTVQANREGADLRVISSTSNTMPFFLFTRPEIRTAHDLK